MNLYQKIWVPVSENEAVPVNSRTIDLKFFKPVEGQIVLSIEEAKQMWQRAVELFCDHDFPDNDEAIQEDFQTYLQHKGINYER